MLRSERLSLALPCPKEVKLDAAMPRAFLFFRIVPMPLYTLCAFPGCRRRVPVGERYCDRHRAVGAERDALQKAERERRRVRRHGTSAQRGYGSKWRAARARFLFEHPLCTTCLKEGRVTEATDVDHVIPHRGDPTLFWDETNWQALCHECHSRKTAREDGAFGNPRVIKDR